jgi:hypothetical protein
MHCWSLYQHSAFSYDEERTDYGNKKLVDTAVVQLSMNFNIAGKVK